MVQETKITAERKKALEEELEQLKTVGRKDAAARIQEARSYGDLSENAEYDEAMSDQAKLEAKIADLENMLKNATVYDESDLGTDVVRLGSKVTISNSKKQKFVYKIVGYAEVNINEGLISDESPVGKALIGHSVGDKVDVEAPIGTLTYKIVEISK